jgi:hypothetical protein
MYWTTTNNSSGLVSELVEPKWKSSSVLPPWMKDYFEWHQEQRKLITEENWDTFKYFVQRCLVIDKQCGGTSDRLQSIPAKLRLAAKYKRILLIIWERPVKLEEFLVPPTTGLDWTAPDWLRANLQPYFKQLAVLSDAREWVIQKVFNSSEVMVDTMSAFGSDSGASWYNKQITDKEEADFDSVHHELWDVLFQPSPPVQALIDRQMEELKLEPMQYHALHIRAQYLSNEAGTPGLVENATNCAISSFGSPTLPLYVATDSKEATRKAIAYASNYTRQAVARFSDTAPLHMDRGADFMRYAKDLRDQPELYYDIFVDVYILSQARCITYGRGGYGRWASLLSSNSSCSMRYFQTRNRDYYFPMPQCSQPEAL